MPVLKKNGFAALRAANFLACYHRYLIAFVLSTYLLQFVSEQDIGLVVAGASVIGLFGLSFFPSFFTRCSLAVWHSRNVWIAENFICNYRNAHARTSNTSKIIPKRFIDDNSWCPLSITAILPVDDHLCPAVSSCIYRIRLEYYRTSSI